MMEDHATNHALTEVALALAMAFFSIMVLAMVSMSVPRAKQPKAQAQAAKVDMPKSSVQLTPVAQDSQASQADDVAQQAQQKVFVFYFEQQFYDQALKPLSLAAISQAKALVLALPPQLTVKQAMAVQQRINRPDMVITQFNQQWQQRLEQL